MGDARHRDEGTLTCSKRSHWPDEWKREYAGGILTVTMTMKEFGEFKENFDDTFEGICQPASFCSWTPDDKHKPAGPAAATRADQFAKQCADLNNWARTCAPPGPRRPSTVRRAAALGSASRLGHDLRRQQAPLRRIIRRGSWSKPFVPPSPASRRRARPRGRQEDPAERDRRYPARRRMLARRRAVMATRCVKISAAHLTLVCDRWSNRCGHHRRSRGGD